MASRSADDEPRAQSTPPTSGTRAVDKTRVLVVGDDERTVAEVVAMLGAQVEAVSCASGRRALELCQRESFHVVCADADMTSMSATELFRRLTGVLGHVGYLMLVSPAGYARGGSDGRWHVVFKPVDAGRLASAVTQLARLSQMRRSVASISHLRRSGS
jgi:PleD family two-component response regulator